jgi:molybdopterin molybdotransferase
MEATARLITIGEAKARVLSAVDPLASEPAAIIDALDRVLTADVVALGDVPPFACSAMDGYAVVAGDSGRALKVVGESRAGTPSSTSVHDGEAIRISTGAAIPAGATAVLRQEDVVAGDGEIETRAEVAAGANIRDPGEDLRAGAVVLAAGTRLGASELGAAVNAGVSSVECARRPRVEVLCTGNELRAPGEQLGPGEIHNSNAATLVALARHCGAVTTGADRLPDDRSATEVGLAASLERADVVVVSGGVSVGPHDHVRPALAALGVTETFWGVTLQPGKPTWFGLRDNTLVFGLPGNPVSAVVTFALFVKPALLALQGAEPHTKPPSPEAELGSVVRLNPHREQALRVRLDHVDGRTIAIPNGPQGSHIMSSLLGADALAMIPPGEGELPAGARVALHHLPR